MSAWCPVNGYCSHKQTQGQQIDTGINIYFWWHMKYSLKFWCKQDIFAGYIAAWFSIYAIESPGPHQPWYYLCTILIYLKKMISTNCGISMLSDIRMWDCKFVYIFEMIQYVRYQNGMNKHKFLVSILKNFQKIFVSKLKRFPRIHLSCFKYRKAEWWHNACSVCYGCRTFSEYP